MKHNLLDELGEHPHLLLKDKVCVIVGVSSLRGIGYATAELFAAHGAKLVIVDWVQIFRICFQLIANNVAPHFS